MANEPQQPSRLTRWLAHSPPTLLATYCIGAAFGTYFCMYGFRKPFTAAKYEGLEFYDIAFKTAAVAAQTAGYTLSKFIGIKVISEMTAGRRAITIVGMIVVAQLALLGFAIVPLPWKLVMLFINGLPLGMVFGLVLAFLEGRRLTEALTAGLCASFIMSSGVVKSVGHGLIFYWHVSDFWMPFWSGLLFFPPLLFAVWLLNQIPPPDHHDVALRRARPPMTQADRSAFLRQHGLSLGLLVTVFILLTIIRSIRDDFGVEIWSDLLGGLEAPEIYSKTEILIGFIVMAINGGAIAIRSNRRALLGSLYLTAGGFVLVLLALLGHQTGTLAPFEFMTLVGLGMYIPYVAYHTTILERFIACIQDTVNLGYLMYIADALGYLGYVGVMIWKNKSSGSTNMLQMFNGITLGMSVLSLLLVVILIVYFSRKIPRQLES